MVTFDEKLWSQSFNLENFQEPRFSKVLIEIVTPNQRQTRPGMEQSTPGWFFSCEMAGSIRFAHGSKEGRIRWYEWGALMPELSRFFGIVIAMYFDDHAPPHFHAIYGSEKAEFRIDPPEFSKGACRRGRWRSLWSGPPSIRRNCSMLGTDVRPGKSRQELSRFNREVRYDTTMCNGY